MTVIPTLTIMLEERHNISAEISYYFFVVQEIGFLLSQLLPYYFTEEQQTELSQQTLLRSAFLILAGGLFLNGPSNLLNGLFSQKIELPIIVIGLFIQGFGVGMLLIIGNIQLLRHAKTEYQDPKIAVINAQSLFVFIQGFGETFGMLIGPLI